MYIIVLLHSLFSNLAHVRNKISCQLYHIAAVGTISGSRVYFKDFLDSTTLTLPLEVGPLNPAREFGVAL